MPDSSPTLCALFLYLPKFIYTLTAKVSKIARPYRDFISAITEVTLAFSHLLALSLTLTMVEVADVAHATLVAGCGYW